MNSFLISFEIEATLFVEMKTRLILYKLGQTKVRSCQLTVVSSQNRVKSGSRCNSKGIKTCIYRSNRTQRRNFVPSLRQIYQFEDTCIGSINNNRRRDRLYKSMEWKTYFVFQQDLSEITDTRDKINFNRALMRI